MGCRWLEYVYDDDLEKIRAFFADGKEGLCEIRCLYPVLGSYYLFTYYKLPYHGNWLALVDLEPLPLLPAPNCSVPSDIEASGGGE